MRGKKAKAIRRRVREGETRALAMFKQMQPEAEVPDAEHLRAYRKRTERILKRNVK